MISYVCYIKFRWKTKLYKRINLSEKVTEKLPVAWPAVFGPRNETLSRSLKTVFTDGISKLLFSLKVTTAVPFYFEQITHYRCRHTLPYFKHLCCKHLKVSEVY